MQMDGYGYGLCGCLVGGPVLLPRRLLASFAGLRPRKYGACPWLKFLLCQDLLRLDSKPSCDGTSLGLGALPPLLTPELPWRATEVEAG